MLTELLSEPGYRQGVVFGISAVLGVGKKVLDAFNIAILDEPFFKIWWIYNNEYNEFKTDASFYSAASIGVPSTIGIEKAISNNSYLIDSYAAEFSTDIAAAVFGYNTGWYGVAFAIRGYDYLVEKFQRQKH